MPVSVVIKLDNVPSKDNERIMRYLQKELGNNRGIFDMRVELISRTKKSEPEAHIQIGARPAVYGYNQIIPELKKARARLSAVSSEDSVGQFFKMEMDRRDTEDGAAMPVAGVKDKDLTSAFTRATAEREKRRPQKGVKSRASSGDDAEVGQAPTKSRKPMPVIGDDAHDQMSSRKIMAGSSDDPLDNSNLAGMGDMDPDTSRYWANQFVTAGI